LGIGSIPTVFVFERGSDANQPLALAVVGGLSSSTLLSTFLVPVMSVVLPDSSRASEHRALPASAAIGARVS
jgi:HAE1 family hydrophobic/amphiphilic exporter-1